MALAAGAVRVLREPRDGLDALHGVIHGVDESLHDPTTLIHAQSSKHVIEGSTFNLAVEGGCQLVVDRFQRSPIYCTVEQVVTRFVAQMVKTGQASLVLRIAQ